MLVKNKNGRIMVYNDLKCTSIIQENNIPQELKSSHPEFFHTHQQTYIYNIYIIYIYIYITVIQMLDLYQDFNSLLLFALNVQSCLYPSNTLEIIEIINKKNECKRFF